MLLTALAMILVGCGIPQYDYIAAPTMGSITADPAVLHFMHDTYNDTEIFLGYEIYYKFYDPLIEASQLASAVSADYSAVAAASPTSINNVLNARGYYRMDGSTIELKPLLRIDAAEKGSPFEVTLSFAQYPVNSNLFATWNAGTPREVTLFRNQTLLGATGEESFEPTEIDVTPTPDEDLPDTVTPGYLGDVLRMGVAVLSYGISLETYAQIYSTAAMISDAEQLLVIRIDY
jgi:hypothetical protein